MSEFTKLSKVQTVETVTDTANVLIEEDGVIKRAPKTEVGGAKEVEPDMVITITCSDSNYNWMEYTRENTVITFGDYTKVLNVIRDNKMPIVKVIFTSNPDEYCGNNIEIFAYTRWYDNYLYFDFTIGKWAFEIDMNENGLDYLYRIEINGNNNYYYLGE